MMKLVCVLLLFFASIGLAQSSLENQARLIGNELRCPVCDGAAITESPSDFARSMLAEVTAQLKAGKSKSDILTFFTSRYGDSVLLKPPFSGLGLLVWLLPLLVFIGGAFLLINYLRRSSSQPLETADPVLLERVKAQLETSNQVHS